MQKRAELPIVNGAEPNHEWSQLYRTKRSLLNIEAYIGYGLSESTLSEYIIIASQDYPASIAAFCTWFRYLHQILLTLWRAEHCVRQRTYNTAKRFVWDNIHFLIQGPYITTDISWRNMSGSTASHIRRPSKKQQEKRGVRTGTPVHYKSFRKPFFVISDNRESSLTVDRFSPERRESKPSHRKDLPGNEAINWAALIVLEIIKDDFSWGSR